MFFFAGPRAYASTSKNGACNPIQVLIFYEEITLLAFSLSYFFVKKSKKEFNKTKSNKVKRTFFSSSFALENEKNILQSGKTVRSA